MTLPEVSPRAPNGPIQSLSSITINSEKPMEIKVIIGRKRIIHRQLTNNSHQILNERAMIRDR